MEEHAATGERHSFESRADYSEFRESCGTITSGSMGSVIPTGLTMQTFRFYRGSFQ